MRATVQRWGNSLALRIPKPLAEEVGIAAGSRVDLQVDGKTLTVRPPGPVYTLEEMLGSVGDDNLHGEVDLGGPLGNEVW